MSEQVNLLEYLTEVGFQRNWHLLEAKWGKHGTSSLLAHSLTVYGMTDTLMDVTGGFSETDRRVALALSFFHDMLKESSSSREVIEERGRLLDKAFTEDVNVEIEEILRGAGFNSREVKQVLSLLPYGAIQGVEHLASFLRKEEREDNPRVRRLVHELSDVLASKKSIDDFSRLGNLREMLDEFGLEIRHHKVSVIRGVLTSILHKTMHQLYKEAGFVPLLYFPEGTVYVGEKGCEEPEFSNFEEKYWGNLKTFLDDVSRIRHIGAEAIGRVNATPIEAPEFAYLNDDALGEFWGAARNQNAIKNPNIQGYGEVVSAMREGEKEVLEDWTKERVGLYYLFLYLKAVLEQTTNKWEDGKALEELNSVLDRELEDSSVERDKFLETIRGMSHTKSKENKIETSNLYRSLFPQELDREELLDEALEFSKRVTSNLRPFAEQHYGLKGMGVAEQILGEVSHPHLGDVEKIVDEVWEEYNEGKNKGTPLCVLCGRKAEKDAVAGLLGKAQTFTNFLRGGTRIAVGNKLRVCGLCGMEMSIRSLYTRNPEFVEYYIVPLLNLSPDEGDRWSDIAGSLISGHRQLGIDPLTRDRTWAELIDKGFFKNSPDKILQGYTSNLLKSLWKNERKMLANSLEKAIGKVVEGQYFGSFEAFAEDYELPQKDPKEAASAMLSGELDIPEVIKEELEELNGPGTRSLFVRVTPNYYLISYPLRRREAEDHEASKSLRHLFRGALLSRLFMGSVAVKELRYEPLVDVVMHGAVKIPTNLLFDKVFRKINIPLNNGWLSLGDVDRALVKLSALFLLAEEFRRNSPKGSPRKGELTTILDDIPGRTLNRLQQMSEGKSVKEGIRLLNGIFSKEVKS